MQYRRLSSRTVKEVIARGLLPELEFGLLKKHGAKLRWSTSDKALFCNMAIDVLECQQEHLKLEVIVRSFCYSRDVTTDYLRIEERFNMKRCVLVMGDVGCQPAPWAGLIQPAVYLHARGFNVLCIEIPEYARNTLRWLKFGPAILRGALRFLCVESVSVLACGNGGALFLEALGQNRKGFSRSHFVYNVDCPPGTRKAPFPVFKLEEHFREAELQMWFGFVDEEDIYNRYEDGTARKSFEAIQSMQARLEGERKRGRRALEYDEILISEQLNTAQAENVQRLLLGRNVLFIFSDSLLESVARYFEQPPTQCQEDMREGLVSDKTLVGAVLGEELPELPAMRTMRLMALGDTGHQDREKLPLADTGYQEREKQAPPWPLMSMSPPAAQTTSRLALVTSASAPVLLSAGGGAETAGRLRRTKPRRERTSKQHPAPAEYLRERATMWSLLDD